jgi:putative salt-induced outer membrane protein YdiY
LNAFLHGKSTFVRIIFLTGLLFPVVILAQKTDVIILNNGDRITGEVKKLEYGLVTFKTDDAGNLSIKWDKISSVTARETFEVETAEGNVYFGSILLSLLNDTLIVTSDQFRFEIAKLSVVSIIPIKNKFFKRLDGSVGVGFSYTKATTLAQLNFNTAIQYRTRKMGTSVSYDGNFSTQEQEGNTRRQEFYYQWQWLLPGRWFFGVQTGFEQNSELGLDMRINLGVGGGRNLIQNNRNVFQALLGCQGISEWLSEEAESSRDLEGIITLNYSLFKYDSPESNISVKANAFPGITDWGRFRLNTSMNISQEIIKDFTIGLIFYSSFDNQPPEGSAKSDWGITTSIGYTF